MSRPLAVLAAGTCLLAAPALADWAPLGNPLSNMPGHQHGVIAARGVFPAGPSPSGPTPNSAIGMLVVWTDLRADAGDLYGRIVTDMPPPDPAPGTDGIPIMVGSGNQRVPAVAEVGSSLIGSLPGFGSAFVVAYEDGWIDSPQGLLTQVRATRLGDLDWGATGVPVHDVGTTSGTAPAVAADNGQGAIVVWTEAATGLRATRAQRLNVLGARQWGANGVPVSGDTTVTGLPQIVRGPGGGAYVLRADRRNGSLTGGARALALFRLEGDGALAAGWPAEGLLLGDDSIQGYQLLSDGNGGAYVLWQQQEVLSNDALGPGVRLARVLADGSAAPGWSLSGTPIAQRPDGHVLLGHADTQTNGQVVLALTYEQVVGGPSPTGVDLVAQRMLPDGQRAPGWPVAGLDLCVAPGTQDRVQVIAAGSGLLAAWCDARADAADLFGAKLEGDGSLSSGWSLNGKSLCSAPEEQGALVLAPATSGGAVFAWADLRDFGATQTDAYAQTVNVLGQVSAPVAPPHTLSLSAPRPQPASSEVSFSLSGPAGEARIEVLDVQGRIVTAWRQVVSSGASSLRWDLADETGRRVTAGLYLLRVRLHDGAAVRHVVVVR